MKTSLTILLAAAIAIFVSCSSNGSNSSANTSSPSNLYEQMISEGWTYYGEVLACADGDLPKTYHVYFQGDRYVATLGHKAAANSPRYPITKGKFKASVWKNEPQSYNGYFTAAGLRMYLSL